MPYSGAGAIWDMGSGTYIATNVAGAQADFDTAKAAISAGIFYVGPGLESLVLGAFGANVCLMRITNTGIYAISRFHMADGADPTKLLRWDLSALTTATTRIATIHDWSGDLLLPSGLGSSGQFLKSNGAGSQPSWFTPTNALLDGANHTDTVANSVTRGSLVYGNATPKWDELLVGGNGAVLTSDGTDIAWSLNPAVYHQSLLHIKPVRVTNCTWNNGSTQITTTTGGFADVQVGDYVSVQDVPTAQTQGGVVASWTGPNTIDVDITNTGSGLSGAVMIVTPGDHFNNSAALDAGTGAGLFLTQGRGTMNTVNTGGSFQEIRGPIRWMGLGNGSVPTDFRVNGSTVAAGGGVQNGFAIWRQGTTSGMYFYTGSLSSVKVINLRNPSSGDGLLYESASASVANKTLTTVNKIQMDGTASFTVFQNSSSADRLAFDLTAMSALRSVSWPNYVGRARVEGAPVTFADADTTPTVVGSRIFKTANTGATSITTFDDGITGQEITIIFGDAVTTLVDGATLVMAGSSNMTFASTDTWTGVYDGSVWYEKCRSIN